MKKYTIFTVFTLFLAFKMAFNQSVEFNKYNFPTNKEGLSTALGYISAGDKYYQDGPGVYRLAIDNYLKADKFNPDNALLNYKLGRCYLDQNDKSEAIKYLEKAIKIDPKISTDMAYNDVNFLLARAYQLDYQFDKAISKFNEHKNSLTPEQLSKEVKTIDKMIGECEIAKKLVAKPVRVFVDNMGSVVNSAYPDYRPLVVPEESLILFTSARESTTGGKRDKDSYYFEDIYVSDYANSKWSLPQNAYDMNSTSHDATAGLSSDGTILYVYKSAGGNRLFESNLVNNSYSFPREMPNAINDGLKQASAALTFDKTTLYFTSSREDGYGGQDIYVSKKDAKDRWQDAVNIGATINTPYDEEGVFITPDGKTLYFSSRGHNTMGGFDIFKTNWVDGKWSNPENLGYPINTPDDDVFFSMAASGQRGYYSSKKKDGFGGHDIYIITFLGAAKPMILSSGKLLLAYTEPSALPQPEAPIEQNTTLSGNILDATTQVALQATIEIVDNSKNELMASFESNSSTGAYLISLQPGKNYGISVNKQDYLFHSENFDIPEDAVAKQIKKDILLKKVEVGTRIVLNNIFYDFNKATLRPESEAELDRLYKLLNENPTLKIEISGHTDNVGSASYNQKLSESRAKSVVNYLLDKGINNTRLTFKGYGFNRPVAGNDTEEGRQQNRRTEFEIMDK